VGGVSSARRDLEAAAAEVAWWHSIALAPDLVTEGVKSSETLGRELAELRLPDLRGKTVIDIGAWDGYFSFAAERAGAARVVAVDFLTWSIDLPAFNRYGAECERRGEQVGDVRYLPELGIWQPESLPGKRGFDVAHEALNSSVEVLVADFLDLDPDVVGTFDVVLFLGVIYHLKDPLGAAEQVRRLTRELAVVESEAIHVPGQEQLALWRFHGVDQLHGGGNWWVPNRRGLEHVLQAAGFGQVDTVGAHALAPTDTEATHYRAIAHARP
jgi:tRNA (mo5U34)-methyltransferase